MLTGWCHAVYDQTRAVAGLHAGARQVRGGDVCQCLRPHPQHLRPGVIATDSVVAPAVVGTAAAWSLTLPIHSVQHLISLVLGLQGRYARSSRGPTGDELIVVTVLVATDGKLDVPNINSQQSLRTTLNRLGSLRSDQVLVLQILAPSSQS